MVGPGRLELPTSRLSVVCSSQLSYRPAFKELPRPGRSLKAEQQVRVDLVGLTWIVRFGPEASADSP